MKTIKVAAAAFAVLALAAESAMADLKFQLVDGNSATSCLNGKKTNDQTISDPNEHVVASSSGNNLIVAVCVHGDSDSAVIMRYRESGGSWTNSGAIKDGCGEVSGASEVKIVNTERDGSKSSFYVCQDDD